MPTATITRLNTAHTAAVLSNGSPPVAFNRDQTGRVSARLDSEEPGT